MSSEKSTLIFISSVILLLISIVFLLAAAPYILPSNYYTAERLPTEQNTGIPAPALEEAARRNSTISLFGELPNRSQRTVSHLLKTPDSNPIFDDSLPFSNTEYIAKNSTLLELTVRETGTESHVELVAVPTHEALSIIAVPLSTFDSSSHFYAPESKRHIVKSTIEQQVYKTPVVIDLNNTVVRYDDQFYLLGLNRSKYGY